MQRDTGASVRIYHLAKGLVNLENKVDVIIPKEKPFIDRVDGITVHGFRGLCPLYLLNVLRKFFGVVRPTALYSFDFLFVMRVARQVRKADMVQIEQQTAGALLVPFIRKVLKKHVVVDCHDVFQALRVEHTNLLRRILETFLEKIAYKYANLILTVSETERDCLVRYGVERNRIEIIPNGVDTEVVVNASETSGIIHKYGLKKSRTVVFMGNLEYLPNREAVESLAFKIAPIVTRELNDVKFLILGKTRKKPGLSNLIFTGFVDNVQQFLAVSDVAVAPLSHGSGTRLKILEYFSCGLPVVSTSVGAEGLDILNGVNIIIEDNLKQFAGMIIKLLQDPVFSNKLGKEARKLAQERYDWKTITAELNAAFVRMFSGRQSAHIL